MADWAAMILRVGEEGGFWPAGREIVTTAARYRPGASEVMALRVGYEKLHARPAGSRRSPGRRACWRTIGWYADEPRALDRPRRLVRRDALAPEAGGHVCREGAAVVLARGAARGGG